MLTVIVAPQNCRHGHAHTIPRATTTGQFLVGNTRFSSLSKNSSPFSKSLARRLIWKKKSLEQFEGKKTLQFSPGIPTPYSIHTINGVHGIYGIHT